VRRVICKTFRHGIALQVARVLGPAHPVQQGRRPTTHEREDRRHPHGHHVRRDHLAQPQADVEALLDDADRGVVDRDLQPYVGIGAGEVGHRPGPHHAEGQARHRQAHRPAGPSPMRPGRRRGGLHRLDRRLGAVQEPPAGLGQPDLAGGAGEQHDPDAAPPAA
jgi:hypothetical protein